jgi:hypothetical protein
MKYLKRFNEHITNDVKTYHGGGYLDNNTIKGVIFTTTNKSAVEEFYVDRGGYLTEMMVKINHPLTIEDGYQFQKIWLPLFDEAGVKYEFDVKDEVVLGEIYKGVWSLDYLNVKGRGGDVLDVIYYEKFIEAAKKHGYDGIIAEDTFFQTTCEVYIPFYKENINVISSILI